MITLFEELVLLKEFEKRENILMEKVAQKKQEKEEMQEKVTYIAVNFVARFFILNNKSRYFYNRVSQFELIPKYNSICYYKQKKFYARS